MKLPDDVQTIIRRYVDKLPVPITSEVAAQEWTHNLCKQLVYSFPGDGWCHKSAGAGRPHSKDCIAIQNTGRFYGWDIVLNAGSPEATLNLNADSQDLTGQEPEPVMPANVLDDGPVDPEDPKPTTCAYKATDLAEVYARFDAIDAKLAELLTTAQFAAAVNGLEDKLDAALPQILTALKAAVCKVPLKW